MDIFIFQALYKRVRGILNKLTPEKFDRLVAQVQELPIDNSERLSGVIDLVFKKVCTNIIYSPIKEPVLCDEIFFSNVESSLMYFMPKGY